MNTPTDEIVLLNAYRDTELHGAELVLRLLSRVDDPSLQEPLTRHLADKAQHVWLWTERIRALGGQPQHQDDGYYRALRRKAGLPTKALDVLALASVIEERLNQRYSAHATRSEVAPATCEILREIHTSEGWYVAWLAEQLQQRAQREGADTVAATLNKYRAWEAEAFAERQSGEGKK